MGSVTRSKWFKVLLISALALFTAQCGDDSEVIVQKCDALDGFEGGDYLFVVDVGGIVDGCAGGLFNGFIDPGPYGPVTLPALGDLPQDITMELPFVGEVTATLSLANGVLRLRVEDPIQLDDIVTPIGAVDVTARVSGTLCPVSAIRVDAGFTVTVQSINPAVIATPCTIGVPATGTLQ